MFKNYVIVALRNIQRQKLYSFIKISGLSIGIAACILIYLFIADELSFDKFHKNGEQLFRVMQIRYDENGNIANYQQFLPAPVGPELKQFAAEIKHQSRFVSHSAVVRSQGKVFQETISLADSPFFEMFSFPLIAGKTEAVLADEHQIVLTQTSAKKYFEDESPLGKILTLSFGQTRKDFVVSGVAKDPPLNSSLQFDLLIHFNNLPAVINDPEILINWERWYNPLFVQIQSGISLKQVDERLSQFANQYFTTSMQRDITEGREPFSFSLQNIRDIYFNTRGAGNTGLIPSFLLGGIALVILLIACMNFLNLSIGSSSGRSMEVGMRKVLGAERRQLIRQFMIEAMVISTFAVVLGLLFSQLLLPKFNGLSGKQLSLSTLLESFHILGLLMVAAFTGITAGSYPALVLSAFRPVDIMKGKLKIGSRSTLTRCLVVFQFALSVILAISAIILGKQVSFLVTKNPGYSAEGLVVVLTQEIEQQDSERLYHLYRNEVLTNRNIQGLTASNRAFGLFLPSTQLERGEQQLHYRFNRVDPHFSSVMNLRLIQGRDFSLNTAADRDAVIVNQRFLEALGPGYQIGTYLGDISQGFPYNCRIIGVIEDCHFRSLREEIEPLLLYVGKGFSPNRDRFSRMFVRVETSHLSETMSFLEKAWKRILPDKPFIYYFQDDALQRLYSREKRWSEIVSYASICSILLACLGIFGLTALTLSQRVKEIGIRKILGASVEQIVYLSLKHFIYLIGLANLIAWPVVYLVMHKVLENYPFRINMGLHYFLLAGAASILLAGITILYLSAKAALQNPIDSLRYE